MNTRLAIGTLEERKDTHAISSLKLGHDSGLINNPHINLKMNSKNQSLIDAVAISEPMAVREAHAELVFG